MPNASVASVEYRDLSRKTRNFRQRVAFIVVMLPFLGWVIADGEWLFALTLAAALSMAAAEFGLLFQSRGLRPALPLLIVGVFILSAARYLWGFQWTPDLFAVIGLLGQVWHLVDYERGATRSGTDYAITMGGILLLGWIGPYLISLRRLPDGLWWMLIVLPSVWLADGLAYLIGHVFGKRPLCRRLSPKKTWEGYLGGIVGGALGGTLLTLLWRIGAEQTGLFKPLHGLLLGTILGILTPLGDLGISMIKRELNVKDTSALLPGHGGLLDRFDSWLWAGVIGYYFVLWLSS
ncbi:MAG: CDP-archaeol synthase [Anaerolineales bacterium]|nr:CDP-archaeol synthase [Anaerolineales bacterium]